MSLVTSSTSQASITRARVRRFLTVTWLMAYTEFKLRFFGSVLGYFWQLIRPLAVFGVLYTVFTLFFKIGGGQFYAVSLLAGIVMWGFFTEGVGSALGSLVANEGIVRKIPFTLIGVPLSTVVTAFLTLLTNFTAVLVVMIIAGVPFSLAWLSIIPIFVVLFTATAGVGIWFSALYVRYRDMRPIWEVISTAGFYLTPILYPIEFVTNGHPAVAKLMLANPVGAMAVEFRHLVLDPAAPGVSEVMGSPLGWIVPLGTTALLLAGGLLVFSRRQATIAEEL